MNTSTVLNVLKTNEQLSALPLRVVAGILFIAHGAQKLFAWFAGYGLEGSGQWMESIGLAPRYLMTLMAGSAEFFGGIFLLVGLLTRPTAVVLAFTVLVAIFAVRQGSQSTCLILNYHFHSTCLLTLCHNPPRSPNNLEKYGFL
jgi:putative oxidoreductase